MTFYRGAAIKASDLLREGAEIYDKNNQIYGDAFVVVGRVMAELLPNGVKLQTEEDFRRFHLLEWTIGKLARYAANFARGGHADSIIDASVYCAMLAAEDKIIAEGKKDG
jgi:hypothetical protein